MDCVFASVSNLCAFACAGRGEERHGGGRGNALESHGSLCAGALKKEQRKGRASAPIFFILLIFLSVKNNSLVFFESRLSLIRKNVPYEKITFCFSFKRFLLFYWFVGLIRLVTGWLPDRYRKIL